MGRPAAWPALKRRLSECELERLGFSDCAGGLNEKLDTVGRRVAVATAAGGRPWGVTPLDSSWRTTSTEPGQQSAAGEQR
jgi:hypothetical protein